MIVIDTGEIVAAENRKDRYDKACKRLLLTSRVRCYYRNR